MNRNILNPAPNTFLLVTAALTGEVGFRDHLGFQWSALLIILPFVLRLGYEIFLLEWFSRKGHAVRRDVLSFLRIRNRSDS
jgi:hypothetical protein